MAGDRTPGNPQSEGQSGASPIGDPEKALDGIRIVDFDAQWQDIFRREAEAIGAALWSRALEIEHTGSTAVPGLAAKPVIDILLVVDDSSDEASYAPALESIGYKLRIREPGWHEHRMFKRPDPETNLHVFSAGCPEIERVLLFRNWLRRSPADRDLYARTKRELARREWKYVQEYADAKGAVVEEILSRARAGGK